jgi:hypothetical protein
MYRKFDVTGNFFYIVHFLSRLNTAIVSILGSKNICVTAPVRRTREQSAS